MSESISKKITEHKHNSNITDYVRVSMNNGAVYVGVLLHIGKSFHINNTVRFIKVNTMTAGIIDIFIGDIQDIEFAVFEKGCAGESDEKGKQEGKSVYYTLHGHACVVTKYGTIHTGMLATENTRPDMYFIITDTAAIGILKCDIQEYRYTTNGKRRIYGTLNVSEKGSSQAGCGWKLDDERSPMVVLEGKVNYTPINKKEMKIFEVRFKERSIPNVLIEAEKFDTTIKDCYAFKVNQEIVSIVDRGSVLGISVKEGMEPNPHKKEKETETR